MPETYVNRIRMNYQAVGSGHPTLFIPDAGYSSWFWNKITPTLAERYQLFVPDPRGTGQTSKPEGPYTVEMMAQDMIELVDAAHCRGLFVIGHGLGAYVAVHMALNRPDLVSKLVIAGGDVGGPSAMPAAPEVEEVLASDELVTLEAVERKIALWSAPGFAQRQPQVARELLAYHMSEDVPEECYAAQLAAIAGMKAPEASLEARLAELTKPTLILAGEQDRVVPPGNAQLLAARLPQARVVILPNTGHLFPIEDPEATAQALLDFLGGRKYMI